MIGNTKENVYWKRKEEEEKKIFVFLSTVFIFHTQDFSFTWRLKMKDDKSEIYWLDFLPSFREKKIKKASFFFSFLFCFLPGLHTF